MLRRTSSNISQADNIDNEDPGRSLSNSQNRSLRLEVLSLKRQVEISRERSDTLSNKCTNLETLFSSIDLNWRCLENDLISLLAAGIPETDEYVPVASNIFQSFLNAGVVYTLRDPTNLSPLTELKVDMWSSLDDVMAQRDAILSKIEKAGLESDLSSPSVIIYGSELDEGLKSRVVFTQSLMERVLRLIVKDGDSGTVSSAALETLTEIKSLQNERASLVNRVAKLSSHLITLSAESHVQAQQKRRCERALDAVTLELSALKESMRKGISVPAPSLSAVNCTTASSAETTAVTGAATTDDMKAAGVKVEYNSVAEGESEAFYKDHIALLEQQVLDSEESKTRVELALNAAMAAEVSPTAAALAKLTCEMESLRVQFKNRVSDMAREYSDLQVRAENLESALAQVETAVAEKMEMLISDAERAIELAKNEKDATISQLHMLKAEVALTAQLKTQVADLQALEASSRSDATKLRSRVTALLAAQQQVAESATNSRKRESEFAAEVQERLEAKKRKLDGSKERDGQICMNDSITNPDDEELSTVLVALEHAQQRVKELEKEVDHARAAISDAFLEIEAVAAKEKESRDLSSKLIRQVAESQGMQSGVLEENLRLESQLSTLKLQMEELKSKSETIESVLKFQESVLERERKVQKVCQREVVDVRRAVVEEMRTQHASEDEVVQVRVRQAAMDAELEAEKNRTRNLQARCDNLANQMDAERTKCMAAQRELRQIKPKFDRLQRRLSMLNDGVGENESDEVVVLKRLLRCPVCTEGFKEKILSRCLHMFCENCLLDCQKSRNRKCPTCHEKFGQEDVQNIRF